MKSYCAGAAKKSRSLESLEAISYPSAFLHSGRSRRWRHLQSSPPAHLCIALPSSHRPSNSHISLRDRGVWELTVPPYLCWSRNGTRLCSAVIQSTHLWLPLVSLPLVHWDIRITRALRHEKSARVLLLGSSSNHGFGWFVAPLHFFRTVLPWLFRDSHL